MQTLKFSIGFKFHYLSTFVLHFFYERLTAAFSMHLSESCVRNDMVKFHKLQATVHFAGPHNDKMAAKVVINTGREAETI